MYFFTLTTNDKSFTVYYVASGRVDNRHLSVSDSVWMVPGTWVD